AASLLSCVYSVVCSFSFFVFFFLRFAYHLSLHSFPTRRSSDLVFASQFFFIKEWLSNFLLCGSLLLIEVIQLGLCRLQTLGHLRSEEHTSELQSRFDLVCRLLLEKKKKAEKDLRAFFPQSSQ